MIIKLKDIKLNKTENNLGITFYFDMKDKFNNVATLREVLNFLPNESVKSMVSKIFDFVKEFAYDYWETYEKE